MKYKHALALNPYYGDSTALIGMFPPTGLEYVATAMKGHVEKLTLMDLRHEKEYADPEKLSGFIRGNVDLLCVSIRWNAFFREICELVNQLPPDVTTVLGGYKATEEVEFLFNECPNVDIIVRGEGEFVIREIADGVPLKDIKGISYRDNGKVKHNENAPLCDLTEIPFPDRSLRKHEYTWVQYDKRITDFTFDTVLTTRGCPYECKFCTFSLNPLGQKRNYAERPLEDVIEELKTVKANVIMLSDDNFFTNPKRSEKLCDMIIEAGIKKTFIVQTRIEIARRQSLLEKAEKAGFKLLLVGIESPHDRILKNLQKGFTREKIRAAFKTLNKYNFYIHGYFIYGNIGETEEEMVYIAQFAKELKLDSISFQKLRVEKFSPLKEVVEQTPGYYYEYIGGPVYSDKYGLKELKRIRDRIKFAFYTPAQLGRIIRKAVSSGLFSFSDLASLLLSLPLSLPKFIFRLAKRELYKKWIIKATT
jgi:anaerobic magnesium-protoporphyrin IX monomethyl ester cyclase